MNCILVIEDEFDIQELLKNYLEEDGYQVLCASDGVQAVNLFEKKKEKIDLVLLDVMLPKIDGFGVLELIRNSSSVPVIMLTALEDEKYQLRGYDLQVDEYVTKPFSPVELTARVDALLRRMGEGAPIVRSGELYQPPFLLNMTNRTLEKNGERVKLTQLEYSIMKLFMENRGKALAREEILDAVWGKGYFGELKIVDVNVRRLRLKIEDDAQEPKYISTVWGFGYKWNV